MGVTQARVSRIERGQLERTEVDTLAAYVKALGGKLKSPPLRRRELRPRLTRSTGCAQVLRSPVDGFASSS